LVSFQQLWYTSPKVPFPKLVPKFNSLYVKYWILQLNGNYNSIVGWYSSNIHFNHFWDYNIKWSFGSRWWSLSTVSNATWYLFNSNLCWHKFFKWIHCLVQEH
jgi:hypothetical protein